MKKTNTWLSLIAAVLAIGALVGIAGMLSKIGSAGADPAEDNGALLTNASNGMEYYAYEGTDITLYGVKTESDKLEAGKKYRVTFNYNEGDHQAFLKKYGLYFDYYLKPDAGNPTAEIPVLNMNGVVSGASYDFLRENDGTLSLFFVSGSVLTGSDKEATQKAILAYMKEKLRFSISELPDDTVISEGIYTSAHYGEATWTWQEPVSLGTYSYAYLAIGPMMTHTDYRIVFYYDQADLTEAAQKLGMEFRYGYTFNLVSGDAEGGVPIAPFNSKGVSNRSAFDFNIGESDVIGIYFMRSAVTSDDPAIDNIDRDAVLAFLKEHIRYKIYKVG